MNAKKSAHGGSDRKRKRFGDVVNIISIFKSSKAKAESQEPINTVILRQHGKETSLFSCGFVRNVYELTAQPISIEELCKLTDSSKDRIRLALHDLSVNGVRFEVRQ